MANYAMEDSKDTISISKQIKLYMRYWKWFVLSVLAAIILAAIYLRYANPEYDTLTTILINDPSEGRGLSELAAFSDLGAFSDMASNDIDDEVEILKSKTLIGQVVQDLNVNVQQYLEGKIKNSSLYLTSPVIVNYDWKTDPYRDQEKDRRTFTIKLKLNSFIAVDVDSGIEYSAKYGEKVDVEGEELLIVKSKYFEQNQNKQETRIEQILVTATPVSEQTETLQLSIEVQSKSNQSSILDISYRSADKLMAQDVLDRLVYQYNQQAVNDKNLVSLNTSKFIADRLEIISKELDEVEFEKANFKTQNRLTDIETEAGLVVEQVGENQAKLLEIETQLALTQSMIDYLISSKRESDLLPANIGIENILINSQIAEYNKLVLERDRLLDVSTALNPLVVNLNSDIDSQKLNLLESLKNQKSNFQIARNDIQRQKGRIGSKIAQMPSQEKDFRAIERKQTIKETLYLFLLQKREEASISTAVTAPIAKVIDKAYSTAKPVSPKKKIVLLAAMMLGLIVPFGIIYVKDLLDTKVREKSDIEETLKSTPVLVEIPKIKRGDSDMLQINDRSVLGESFRILRTNLNYFSRNRHKENKALRVFVTSTIKGEGKTFVSFNTILALAATSKKVLVIGADIRNPQLHRYLKIDKNQKGLSDYLYNDDTEIDEITHTAEMNGKDIDFITSGPIPPNPSELLMNGRLENLLTNAEDHYDYIVVDTAPTMLVTDTLLLTESADVTMYVVRADYTEKELLKFVRDTVDQGKIKNIAVVLNDVDQDKVGYGYGYGYGVEQESFWKRLLKR